MSVAILSIGTELTRGEIVNTNAAWLATELTGIGFSVTRVVVIPDTRETIIREVQSLAPHHSAVIVTGGLGPTTDDLTADALAAAAHRPLELHEESLVAITRRVTARGRTMTDGHRKQARIPQGSEVIPNPVGTAPGFVQMLGPCAFIVLPGVPQEARAMFDAHVIPRIRPLAPRRSFQVRLRTWGLGESELDAKLSHLERNHEGLILGYRVMFPAVEVKLLCDGVSYDQARARAEVAAREAKALLGDAVYGEGDDDFAQVVGRLVRARGWRLAVAESCTGGLISHLLTRFPSSDFFALGAVTYENAAKTAVLRVSEDTLRGHGAVSTEVALEMARGARRVAQCDVGIGVTGIAGPTGGTAEKPVGLVHWAVVHPGGEIARDRVFSGDRNNVQSLAAHAALNSLRRIALNLDG